MARIKKYAPNLPQKLTTYQTFINDVKLESEYFKVSDFKDIFSGGKNGFLLEGSEHLQETTEIQIQILDAFGNPVYFEPGRGVPEYYEGVSKPISVHIYNDTPVGNAKITILGELKSYVDAGGVVRDVPVEWRGVYNVKWERSFIINKTLANEHRVRFLEFPEVRVNELSGSVYQAQVEEFINKGYVSGIPITPDEGTVLPNKYYGDILFKLSKSGSSEIDIPVTALEPPIWTNTRTPLPQGRYLRLKNCGNGSNTYYLSNPELLLGIEFGSTVVDCFNVGNLKLISDTIPTGGNGAPLPNGEYYIVDGVTNDGVDEGNTAVEFTSVVVDLLGQLVYGCNGEYQPRSFCVQYNPDYDPNPTPLPPPPNSFTGSNGISYVGITDYGIFPTGSVLNPVITIPSASIYDEPIYRFLNNTELLIRKANLDEFNTVRPFGGKTGNEYEYEIRYNSIVNQATSSILASYAEFKIDKLTTFIGDVGRVKIFYRPTLSITDFVLIDDIPIESVELLRLPLSGSFYNYGKFRPDYETYWNVSSIDNHTIEQSDDIIYDGVIVQELDETAPPFTLSTIEQFTMLRNQEYTVTADIQYSGDYDGAYFKMYLTGSSLESEYQEIFIKNAIPQYTVQNRISENFIIKETGDYRIVIETNGNRWDYGNISVKTASDTNFSPDYMEFVLTVPRRLPEETFDFKFDFYDINNNYIPVELFARRITFREGSGGIPIDENLFNEYIQIIQNQINIIGDQVYTGVPGHLIQDSGSLLPHRENLNFVRLDVYDDIANNATIVFRPPSVIVSETAPNPNNEILEDGDEWINSITWKKYIWYGTYWVETGKVDCNNYINQITPTTTFIALTDTPASYTGQSGKLIGVNQSETGLTYYDIPTGNSFPPIHNSYNSVVNMVLDQSNQLSNYIYFDGTDYWEYLGTTTVTINDYRKITSLTATSGTSGSSGTSGTSGTSGSSGVSGEDGLPGTSGTSGTSLGVIDGGNAFSICGIFTNIDGGSASDGAC